MPLKYQYMLIRESSGHFSTCYKSLEVGEDYWKKKWQSYLTQHFHCKINRYYGLKTILTLFHCIYFSLSSQSPTLYHSLPPPYPTPCYLPVFVFFSLACQSGVTNILKTQGLLKVAKGHSSLFLNFVSKLKCTVFFRSNGFTF